MVAGPLQGAIPAGVEPELQERRWAYSPAPGVYIQPPLSDLVRWVVGSGAALVDAVWRTGADPALMACPGPGRRRHCGASGRPVGPGAKIGVLGLNGSGKSTLLKIMAGIDKEIEARPCRCRASRSATPQEPQLDPEQTVRRRSVEGMAACKAAKKLEEVYAITPSPTPTSTRSPPSRRSSRPSSPPPAAEHRPAAGRRRRAAPAAVGRQIGNLSGGEKRRVALCRLLLSKPDMLLLDEPTNHLDAESVEWLEQFLQRFPGTVVAITHDRYFLDNAAEVDPRTRPRHGHSPGRATTPTGWTRRKQRLEQEQKSEDARTKAMKEGARMGAPTPRAARPRARRAWPASRNSDVEYQKRNETNEIFIPVAERLGNEVIEFKNVSKSFGDRC